MNQVTNLNHWVLYEKKLQIWWGSPQVFDPHISTTVRFVVDGVAKLVFVSVVAEADDSLTPTLHHPSALLPCLPNL